MSSLFGNAVSASQLSSTTYDIHWNMEWFYPQLCLRVVWYNYNLGVNNFCQFHNAQIFVWTTLCLMKYLLNKVYAIIIFIPAWYDIGYVVLFHSIKIRVPSVLSIYCNLTLYCGYPSDLRTIFGISALYTSMVYWEKKFKYFTFLLKDCLYFFLMVMNF